MGEDLFAKNLRLSFDAGFRGRHKESMGLMSGTHGSPFGRRRMCFARTAALQGGFEKQKVNASRDFLHQSLHHVQKSFESYARNMFCSRVRHGPKSIKHRKNYGFVA